MQKDSIEYRHLKEVDSTNALASRVLTEELPEYPIVFSTDTQIHGRGQRGTTWHDEAGKNLLMTVLSAPISWPANRVFELNMAIALAIHRCLSNYFPLHLKWPNDLVVGSQKIAGMLIEPSIRGAFIQRVIVGLGLNVYQSQWSKEVNATSVALQIPNPPEINTLKPRIAEAILEAIDKLQVTGKSVKEDYLKANIGFETWAQYSDESNDFNAKFLDVDETGKQILLLRNGDRKAFDLKEVKLVGLL